MTMKKTLTGEEVAAVVTALKSSQALVEQIASYDRDDVSVELRELEKALKIMEAEE